MEETDAMSDHGGRIQENEVRRPEQKLDESISGRDGR
jgi:hypothetical protein